MKAILHGAERPVSGLGLPASESISSRLRATPQAPYRKARSIPEVRAETPSGARARLAMCPHRQNACQTDLVLRCCRKFLMSFGKGKLQVEQLEHYAGLFLVHQSKDVGAALA